MDRITTSLVSEFARSFGFQKEKVEKQFEYFAAYSVVRRHYHEVFDPEVISTDGGGDGGIDAVAVVVNGTLIEDIDQLNEVLANTSQLDVSFSFVQATVSAQFDSGKIGNFAYGVEDFFNSKPKMLEGENIKAANEIMSLIYDNSGKFRGTNPLCRLFYVSTGTWNNDAPIEARRAATIASLKSTNLFRDVHFEMIGAQQVQQLYNNAKNNIVRKFQFKQRTTVPSVDGIDQAFLGYIPAKTFVKIVTDDESQIIKSIFHDNVRDWQGDNAVNSGIRDTIKSAVKSKFVLMNNGITIIARKIQITSDDIQIEDFQIVNGCQTSHCLVEEQDALDDSVNVPLKLISTSDENVINSIVQATNRQTKVDEVQFFSLSEFAKRLERYFATFEGDKRLYYERRSNQYSSSSVDKLRIVTQKNMLNAFAGAYLNEAHSTTRNHKSLEAKIGSDVFNDLHTEEPYYAAAYALFKIESLFKEHKIDRRCKPAKFNIVQAAKILAVGPTTPAMNSRDIKKMSERFLDELFDEKKANTIILKAAGIIEKVAAGDFDRDKIRVIGFTNSVRTEAAAEFNKMKPATSAKSKKK